MSGRASLDHVATSNPSPVHRETPSTGLRRLCGATTIGAALVLSACSGSDEDGGSSDDALTAAAEQSAKDQAKLAAFYEGWDTRRPAIVSEITKAYGSPLENMDETAYSDFLRSLDLATDDGMMRWAAAAGIHVVALTRTNDFFYYNVHLLPEAAGANLEYAVFSSFKSEFVPGTGKLSLVDKKGAPLSSRTLLPDAIVRTESRGSLKYYAGFREDRLHYATLSGYLAPLSAIPNRAPIADGLRSMPLFMVKALRGKGFFLSTNAGRSFTLAMPVGNDVYPLYAGLTPGAFFETNTRSQTPETVVHEFCHVIDHTVMKDRYGSILYPYGYPAITALKGERDALFEPRPADTSKGFVSDYSKSNAQEDFAEHCWAYARHRTDLEKQAQAEVQQGSDLLQRKFAFMEKLFAQSPAFVRLSSAVLDELAPSGGTGDTSGDTRGAAGGQDACGSDPVCEDAACLAALQDVAASQRVVAAAIGVGTTCGTSSEPRRVANPTDPNDYYYNADVSCTLASAPSASAQESFLRTMESKGYYGFELTHAEDGTPIVKGQTTTRYCSTF